MMNRYLTEAEQPRLLNAAKHHTDPLAQRDFHWMRLLIETGMRVGEFSLLSLAQAERALSAGWLVTTKDQRKGGRVGHEYLVTQSVRQSLEALCFMSRTEAPGAENAPLVWGRDGGRLSIRSYQARLKLWVKAAGLNERISVHALRHTRGMNIMRRSRGKNALQVAQQALGHASLSSTQIYTRMSREEYTESLRQVDTARLSKGEARRQAAAQGAAS